MSKTLLLYSTISGNSALLASQLLDKLTAQYPDREFELLDTMDADNLDHSQYDPIIFIFSSWDGGQPNFNAREYLENLTPEKVSGKNFAIIGLGDSAYEGFCGGVEIAEKRLTELGAKIITQSFKIDGFIEDEVVNQALAWTQNILQ